MTSLTPSIAEDIQMLANIWLEEGRSRSMDERRELIFAAERVEAYLSTFKPDHL